MYTCPVCFFDQLTEPPRDYNICDCCGTEFGNDDEVRTHEDLRRVWIGAGTPWFFGDPPVGWNPLTQVIRAFKEAATITYATKMVYGGGNGWTYMAVDTTNTMKNPAGPPCVVPVYGLAA